MSTSPHEPAYMAELRRYLREVDEIDRLPNGLDSDHMPQRLSASAARLRRARERSYPPISGERLATVASLLGMRVS